MALHDHRLVLRSTGVDQALARSEHHLAMSQRVARMGSWQQNLDTGRGYWSEQLYRLLELEPDPALAGPETFLARVHPDDAPRFAAELDRAGRDGGRLSARVRLRLGGRRVWVVEVLGRVERDAAGVRRSIGTVQDITDRAELEKDIRNAAERFRVIFDAAPMGMALVDARAGCDPVVLMANAALAELVGQELGDLVGGGVRELLGWVPDPTRAAVERELRRPDGTQRWVSVAAAPVPDGDGMPHYHVLHLVDVTERRRAEALARASDARDARIAAVLQRSLFPFVPRRVGPVTVATRYIAAAPGEAVGGDWTDVFSLPGGRIGIVVGDVAGHGIEAAATMTRLRALVRMLATSGARPAGVLRRLNDVLHDGDLGEAIGGEEVELATLVHGQLDPRTGRFVYSSAGHLPLIAVPPAEPGLLRLACPLPSVGGPALGAVPEYTYTEQVLALEAGTTMIGFTDGLVERRGQDLHLALLALVEALNDLPGTATGDAETLADHVLASANSQECEDDIAVIVLGFDEDAWAAPRGGVQWQ